MKGFRGDLREDPTRQRTVTFRQANLGDPMSYEVLVDGRPVMGLTGLNRREATHWKQQLMEAKR